MHALAAPGQARAQDTLRWGSLLNVTVPQGNPNQTALNLALMNAFGKQGKQLVNAHWRWPLSWRVALMVTPVDVTGDILVQFAITVGSGDGQQTLRREDHRTGRGAKQRRRAGGAPAAGRQSRR